MRQTPAAHRCPSRGGCSAEAHPPSRSTLAGMGEVADAYAGCRQRIGDLTRDLDEAHAASTVPTCPKWSVHDVIAHVSGVVDDVLAGRLDGIASEPWTTAQVDARRARSIVEMLAEWDAAAPLFEGMLDEIGTRGRQAVADVVTHE